jgi:hypothetical protein
MTHDHVPAQPSLFAKRPLLTGVAIGAASLLPHAFLPAAASIAFAAVLIAMIGGVYFGFAVVHGSPRDQLVEFNVSSAFATAGLLGLLYWPVVIPVAYLAHAAWDLLHHNRARLPLVAIPQWYVPWCAVIDLIIGVGLFALWGSAGVL